MAANLFLDTCALFKRYVAERGSDTMRAIVGTAEFRGRLFVCERIHGEILSSFGNAFRKRRLDKKAYRTACREFYSHYPSIFGVVEDNESIREDSIQILSKYYRIGITHPDATHLAAQTYLARALPDPNLTLVTSDGGLKAVARRRRVPIFDPETDRLTDIL